MPLTDTAIRAAKPADNAFKLRDEKALYLLISPAGGKWWRLDYRFDGQKCLETGAAPGHALGGSRSREGRVALRGFQD